MAGEKQSLLGVGVYLVPEAARLTGVPARQIRRWLEGYTFSSPTGVHASPPVWQRQIFSEDSLALSFRDLLEVRFVNAFRRHGVPWKTIRLAAGRAAEILEDAHPFSTKKFKTDGYSIFADIVQKTGEESLLDLARSQYAFKQVVEPFLFAGLEFSGIEPVRWWPMTQSRRVVLDPERAFGRPIVAPESVPTEILARAFQAEGSLDAVARWFLVDPKAVADAVEFEQTLAPAA